jgi:hypothetical protein
MDTLVHISAALQRSRTGLKLMSQLLVDHRDDWRLGQLVPLGDLYPAIAGGGDKAFSGETNVHFEAADKLYRDKLRPYLLKTNQVTDDQVEAYRRSPESLGDPQLAARCRDFTGDSRLLQTLLLSALAPSVPALADLTLARLHALNHGSITTRIAGTEVGRLEQKVKEWAATFPEIKVAGTGPGAVVRLELTGVDLDAVLANAQVHNNLGNRRAKMRSLLKDALGVGDGPGGFDAYDSTLCGRAPNDRSRWSSATSPTSTRCPRRPCGPARTTPGGSSSISLTTRASSVRWTTCSGCVPCGRSRAATRAPWPGCPHT